MAAWPPTRRWRRPRPRWPAASSARCGWRWAIRWSSWAAKPRPKQPIAGGLAGTDEPDVRTRLLVALGNAVADHEERRQLLHGAVELSGNLVSAAMATILLGAVPDAN